MLCIFEVGVIYKCFDFGLYRFYFIMLHHKIYILSYQNNNNESTFYMQPKPT